MSLRLYDTRAQSILDFIPREPGVVRMYVCGPTVQSAPHIGHLRSALAYDQLRRWLEYRGFDVTMVRNVTDIDDKILINAQEALEAGGTEQWWALAYRVEREFSAGYDRLGILPPTYEPRATASIGEMVELIERLIERGHAYAAPDASGDVYFDTSSWPDYGELTHQAAADMEAAADADPRGKRDARDFALWKGRKAGEPASAAWPSPWGAGRPGWHIECSAMSRRYLGDAFDIHGGGLDLRFPHHENEIAQSRAAGYEFATYWIHNGLVNVAGQKMSKSLGNSIFAADLLEQADPLVIRYALGSAHYRSTVDFTPGSLDEAAAALARITGFLERGEAAGLEGEWSVPEAFGAAMDDDLGVPQALGVLHDAVRAGNAAMDAGAAAAAATAFGHVRGMVDVLGIDPLNPRWRRRASDSGATTALGALVDTFLTMRSQARADKDWAAADDIRGRLSAAGITIEDTPSGAKWSIHG